MASDVEIAQHVLRDKVVSIGDDFFLPVRVFEISNGTHMPETYVSLQPKPMPLEGWDNPEVGGIWRIIAFSDLVGSDDYTIFEDWAAAETYAREVLRETKEKAA